MKMDGGCHCGHITYEAEVDPDNVAICHCTDCQTLSGTAFRTVVPAPENGFTLLSGNPKIYIKTGSSGAIRIQSFCPECGSPFYSISIGGGPKVYNIRLGTVCQRDQLPPKVQIWTRSAQHWLTEMDSVRKIDMQ
jgi:hypothetical protein